MMAVAARLAACGGKAMATVAR